MRTIGLRSKVIISVSLLVALIIAINAYITIRTERHERERQLVEQGRLFARLTATDVARSYGSVSWGLPGGPPWGAGQDARGNFDMQLAKFFSYYPDLSRLSIISQGGLVLYDSGAEKGGAPGRERISDPELVKRLLAPEMDVRQFTGPDGQRYMDIVAPVTEAGGPQFLKVRFIISFRSLEERLAAIRREFLLLAGFFMAAGIAAAMVFSARLTRPVVRLREGAGEIAKGNYDHLVEIEGKDEIGELGRSFNQMAAALKGHRRSIEEANVSLVAANAELKELQRELVRSERMAAVGELAAGLSHEIDNPIGVILGFAELLLDDMPAADPRREDLMTIVEESNRCKRIVRGLLDFSRPPVLGVVPTAVDDVIRRTAEAAGSQRLFKRIRINLDLPPGAPEIMADPDRLKQVFMNLMLNAAQAMPEGGEIDIAMSYAPDERKIRVAFKDTGAGIPAGEMGRIFEPFYTTKRPGEGTGLGLAICVRLLEEHGGSITAESEPGEGSTFTVTLPIEGGAEGEKA